VGPDELKPRSLAHKQPGARGRSPPGVDALAAGPHPRPSGPALALDGGQPAAYPDM